MYWCIKHFNQFFTDLKSYKVTFYFLIHLLLLFYYFLIVTNFKMLLEYNIAFRIFFATSTTHNKNV